MIKMIRNILAISLVAVLPLGCGGGGGTGMSQQPAGMSQQPAGMPDADNLTQLNRDALLLMSDMYLYGRDQQGEAVDFTIDTTCSLDGCVASNAPLGFSERFVIGDFVHTDDSISDDLQLVGIGSKNGVELYRASQTIPLDDGDADVEGYGAWMKHNFFGSFVGETTIQGTYFLETGYGMSVGNISGRLPAISATYEGVMLGVDSSGANRGEHVEGNAQLEFRVSAGDARMDVSFANIRGRSTGGSYENIEWRNGRVENNGTFDWGTINGTFYGPNHEEVGGTFSTVDIVGAYGARK